VLGLDKTVTSLLAGAGVLGLALAFAFQDIAGNFMSGILLALRRPFGSADWIETNDFFGVVEDLNLRSTIVRTPQGQLVTIPNSSVLQNPIKNYTKLGKRRVDLSCGVAYGDDLDKVEKVAPSSLNNLDFIDSERPVDFYFTEFGGSSIDFKLRFWIDFKGQADFLKAQSEAIKALKAAFDQSGITIPFPIRTLDFGVVGGVNLNEVLPQQYYEKQTG
jgi:small conductance mechanosensitive channel